MRLRRGIFRRSHPSLNGDFKELVGKERLLYLSLDREGAKCLDYPRRPGSREYRLGESRRHEKHHRHDDLKPDEARESLLCEFLHDLRSVTKWFKGDYLQIHRSRPGRPLFHVLRQPAESSRLWHRDTLYRVGGEFFCEEVSAGESRSWLEVSILRPCDLGL